MRAAKFYSFDYLNAFLFQNMDSVHEGVPEGEVGPVARKLVTFPCPGCLVPGTRNIIYRSALAYHLFYLSFFNKGVY